MKKQALLSTPEKKIGKRTETLELKLARSWNLERKLLTQPFTTVASQTPVGLEPTPELHHISHPHLVLYEKNCFQQISKNQRENPLISSNFKICVVLASVLQISPHKITKFAKFVTFQRYSYCAK